MLRAGNNSAFDKVFICFYPKILSFNIALFGYSLLEKDVANQVFVGLWNNRDRLKPSDNFGRHMYTIVRRTVISFLLYFGIGKSEKIVEKNALDFDNSSFSDDV